MFAKFVRFNRDLSEALERSLPKTFGAPSYTEELLRRIENSIEQLRPRTILEVGGVDRPLLRKNANYDYIGVDIDDQPGCRDLYDEFIVQSVERPMPRVAEMIISTTLLEHVPNNSAAILSMYESLVPGGATHHYIPSKWHPYSICLRLVGPKMQKKLIALLRPSAQAVTGYPAFFDHCSPSAMRALFIQSGFEKIDVRPFYRANDYFAFFLPAYLVVTAFENVCSLLKLSFFASGFIISAHRPVD